MKTNKMLFFLLCVALFSFTIGYSINPENTTTYVHDGTKYIFNYNITNSWFLNCFNEMSVHENIHTVILYQNVTTELYPDGSSETVYFCKDEHGRAIGKISATNKYLLITVNE